MQQDLVSIITPLFNSGRYIENTIRSIQSQSYQNWELLVTDDCSTDDSYEIVRRIADSDSRIRLFKLNRNSGAGVARNNSIREAKGRFIAFCDSDDCWLPEKLEQQIKFLKENGVSVAYSSYLTCNESDSITGIVVAYKKIDYKNILRDDSIGFLTCIYDAGVLGKVYMPEIRKRQDWALKILLLHKTKFALGQVRPLAIYRIRENSLSNNKFDLIKYNIRVYRDVLKYGFVKAWLMFFFCFMPTYFAKKLRLRIINQ